MSPPPPPPPPPSPSTATTTTAAAAAAAAFVAPAALALTSLTPRVARLSARRGARPVAPRARRFPCTAQSDADGAGADAADDAPSDTYVPASEASLPGASDAHTADADAPRRAALLSRLLTLCAASARGQLATAAQRAAVDDAVLALEDLSPTPAPVDTDALDGLWTLVYTDGTMFSRLPPPLAALARPLLTLGQVRQRVALDEGKVWTEVDLVAFPGNSFSLATAARVTPVGADRLELAVEKSTITAGKLVGTLDLGGLSWDIPVEQIASRLRGTTPETYFDTYYVDDRVRISRSKAGKLFVYTRLE